MKMEKIIKKLEAKEISEKHLTKRNCNLKGASYDRGNNKRTKRFNKHV